MNEYDESDESSKRKTAWSILRSVQTLVAVVLLVAGVGIGLFVSRTRAKESPKIAPVGKPILFDEAIREELHRLVDENYEKQLMEGRYNNDVEYTIQKLERRYHVAIDSGQPRKTVMSGAPQYHLSDDASGLEPGPAAKPAASPTK